jgi:hypothetical protein
VRSASATVDGPQGPVRGTAQVLELLMDGTVEEAVFAPSPADLVGLTGGTPDAGRPDGQNP